MKLKRTLDFLTELEVNNNRNWFKENDSYYRGAKEIFDSFINQLIPELKNIDNSIDVTDAKSCVFRIYRDVRFSKNKDPYKTNFGAYIARGGRKSNFAGYYLHMQPDQSFLGGGVYMPQPPELKAIRNAIYQDPNALLEIINDEDFRETYPELYGEQLKSAPRGFPKDFEHLDLIRYKHYVVSHEVNNKFWTKGDPLDKTIKIFEKQRPFNAYLNNIIEKL